MRPLRSSFARPPASTGGVWMFIAGGSAGRQSGAPNTALRSGPAPPPWHLVRARRRTIPTRLPQATPSPPRGRPPPRSSTAECRRRFARSCSAAVPGVPWRAMAFGLSAPSPRALPQGPAPDSRGRRGGRTQKRPAPSGNRPLRQLAPRRGPCPERSEAETTAPPSARRRMISASRTGSARGRPSVRTSCAPSFAGRA